MFDQVHLPEYGLRSSISLKRAMRVKYLRLKCYEKWIVSLTVDNNVTRLCADTGSISRQT